MIEDTVQLGLKLVICHVQYCIHDPTFLLFFLFYQADVSNAEFKKISSFLKQGMNPNIHDKEGLHPLFLASRDNRKDLVELLLTHGALVDLQTNDLSADTPLLAACERNHHSVATYLIEQGANVNYQNKLRKTALYYACQNGLDGVVTLLLDKGAKVNQGTVTPLYRASYNGKLSTVKILVSRGARTDQPNDDWPADTPLLAACKENHLGVATYLIEQGANVNYQNKVRKTALYYASLDGHDDVVTLLLDMGAKVNQGTETPLYGASYNGKLSTVKILVSQGAKVDQPNDDQFADTPLLAACEWNHPQVATYLIEQGADENYQNKKGATALNIARQYGYSKIVAIFEGTDCTTTTEESSRDIQLEREKPFDHDDINGKAEEAVNTPDDISKEISMQKEATSEEGTRKDTSIERKTSLKDNLPLAIMPKEGYVCVAQSSECLVYLPQEINERLSIKTITDTTVHPNIASNEIKITPVVRISSCNQNLSLEMPAIIELTKTVELSHPERDNKVIAICAESESAEWKELGSESNCRMLRDRVSFVATHFSLCAAISQKPYPSSTVKLKPFTENTTPDDYLSTPTQLTIPELPGFKVQIPPFSINTDKETNVTATVLYDSSTVCSVEDRSRLASSVIELEPHDATFNNEVSISIHLPNYAEIKENYPNARVQIFHARKHTSDNLNELDWSLVEHTIRQDEESRYVAIVLSRHFSWYKALWDMCQWTVSRFYDLKFDIKERCQVFMSREAQLLQGITFSITVLFYPYKKEPEPLPPNHEYMLLDSGLLDLKVSKDDELHFEVELNGQLSPKTSKLVAGSFTDFGRQLRSFRVELDRRNEVQENFPMGELSIGVRDYKHHSLPLIKPVGKTSRFKLESSSLPSTSTGDHFEGSIAQLEFAAKKLDKDATQHQANPGAMVEAAKKIAGMWMEMAKLIRNNCTLKERFKEDIVDLAKRIDTGCQEVVRMATGVAEACTDKIMKNDVIQVVERVDTISHQLRMLSGREASRQRDDVSDLEACRLLATNAKNLTLAISDTLYRTQCASIRVSESKREELGLTSREIDNPDDMDGTAEEALSRLDNTSEEMSKKEATSEKGTRKYTSKEEEASLTDSLQLLEIPKEGYVCTAQNSECLVYLPQQINEALSIETISNTSIHPNIDSNEIQITPVVRITSEPDKPNLSLEMPAVIELVKTIELSHKEVDNEVIIFCAKSESAEWRELGTESKCTMYKDRVSFEVTHFGLSTAICRKPYPSRTVTLEPFTETSLPDNYSSTPTEITIPELAGFKVQFPPFSINADRETDVTATLLYDSSIVCDENIKSRLASSVIKFEPHGATFSRKVAISIPIPYYAEVKENQLQIWHSNGSHSKKEWNLVDHSMHQDEQGRYIAMFQVDHFSELIPVWLQNLASFLSFRRSFDIKERCQVFVSQEMKEHVSQHFTFNIYFLFYPFKEEPEPLPCNYEYTIWDSHCLSYNVSNGDKLHFAVELKEWLSSTNNPISGIVYFSGYQHRTFEVKLKSQDIVHKTFNVGELSIGVRECNCHTLEVREDNHTVMLTKPASKIVSESKREELGLTSRGVDAETRLSDDDCSNIYSKLEDKAFKWRDIGAALGFKEGEMNNIQGNPMLVAQFAPKSYLKEMLSQWLQWAPDDSRGSTSYPTKELLHAALLNANLGREAEEFQ